MSDFLDTLRNQYKRIGGLPGFTSEAFSALESKSKQASEWNSFVKCALIIDKMSIREHRVGYIDLHTGLENDELPPTKESFTFIDKAIYIYSNWKVPVGYF